MRLTNTPANACRTLQTPCQTTVQTTVQTVQTCIQTPCKHTPYNPRSVCAPLARAFYPPANRRCAGACTRSQALDRPEPAKAGLHSRSPAEPICGKLGRAKPECAGQRMGLDCPQLPAQRRNLGTLAYRSCQPGLQGGSALLQTPLKALGFALEANKSTAKSHGAGRFRQPFMGVTNLTISKGCARARGDTKLLRSPTVTATPSPSVPIDSIEIQARCQVLGPKRPRRDGTARPTRFPPDNRHPLPISRLFLQISLPLRNTSQRETTGALEKDRGLIFGGAVLENLGSVWTAPRRASQTHPCAVRACRCSCAAGRQISPATPASRPAHGRLP